MKLVVHGIEFPSSAYNLFQDHSEIYAMRIKGMRESAAQLIFNFMLLFMSEFGHSLMLNRTFELGINYSNKSEYR